MCSTSPGISEMRQAYREKEDSKKMKQKQRDKMSAKTGKMDIDYAVRGGGGRGWGGKGRGGAGKSN